MVGKKYQRALGIISVSLGLAFTYSGNLAAEDEPCAEGATCDTIVIVGDKPNDIWNGGGGYYGGGGSSGGSGVGVGGGSYGPQPETPQQCAERIEDAVENCIETVTTGGIWMGSTFCVSVGVISSFFTSPLGGVATGAACTSAGFVLRADAVEMCRAAGKAETKQTCK